METKNTSIFSDMRFPSYIRGNPDFVQLQRFVKSYFESLDQVGGASNEISYARENSDIDTTTTIFLDRFFEILAPDLPTTLKSDKRFLLKHAKELYVKKGTPESFHMLFKILYDDTIVLKYPGESIFRASDGIWNQTTAIHVTFPTITTAQALNLAGHSIVCSNDSGIVRNTALQIKKLQSTNLYEITIDKQQNSRFFVGNSVIINGVAGNIVPSIQNIKVVKPGYGFKLGQIIKLDFGTSSGAVAKITRVNDAGGLLKLRMIRYGVGYNAGITMSIRPASGIEPSSVLQNADLPINDTFGFTEYGFIEKRGRLGPLYDYFLEDYMEATAYYTSAIVSYFGNNTPTDTTTPAVVDPDSYAFLTINIGAVISYPGYWSNNRGNVSDPSICMQDNDYYQNFSYVIQSSTPRAMYDAPVKKILHPAGMKMFSELLLENAFEVTVGLMDVSGVNYRVFVNEIVDMGDGVSLAPSVTLTDSTVIEDMDKYTDPDYATDPWSENTGIYFS